MSALRLRRLTADHQKLRDYCERHPRLTLLTAQGDPPESYQVQYKIKSLRRVDERLDPVGLHVVEIQLPRDYPRVPPQCRMLTPVFHPNIAPHAICVGDHWSAGEPISSIVARIGEMLAFQSYNTKSPLNGEAARWVDENQDRLPLDQVNMLLDEPAPVPPPQCPAPPPPRPAASAEGTPDPSGTIAVRCAACDSAYRVAIEHQGRRVRCRKCQAIMTVPVAPPEG
ncbi:MAG: ubiquitin-conjugating enzyme E2 [Planctomycetales bacterium]